MIGYLSKYPGSIRIYKVLELNSKQKYSDVSER